MEEHPRGEHSRMSLGRSGFGTIDPSVEQRSAVRILPSLTREFLAYLAAAPRTYAEAMDAWRTTCPRWASRTASCCPRRWAN